MNHFFPHAFLFVQILPALDEKAGFLILVWGILWNSVWASLVVEPSSSVAVMIFNLVKCALEKERCLQLPAPSLSCPCPFLQH